jgi:hypothetical protein
VEIGSGIGILEIDYSMVHAIMVRVFKGRRFYR